MDAKPVSEQIRAPQEHGYGSLVVARHGETEWSATGRHTSTTDVPLTDLGVKQATRLGAVLARKYFALVLTSPLRRARDTARAAGFAQAEVVDEATEWNYGVIEGRTTAEISATVGHAWNIWGAVAPDPTPAETCAAVGKRADAVIARAFPAILTGNDVLLFAHAHFSRILAARWLEMSATFGERLAMAPAAYGVLGFERDTRVLAAWNVS